MITYEGFDVTDLDVPLLRKAVDWAAAEAEKPWAQRLWDQRSWEMPSACGTVYCVAGYVVNLQGTDTHQFTGYEYAVTALDALGIRVTPDSGWSFPLFHGANTLEDVQRIASEMCELVGDRL